MADIPDIHRDGAEQRQARQIERERAMLAEGQAQLDRGEVYDFHVVEAWLDELGRNPDAKLPPFANGS